MQGNGAWGASFLLLLLLCCGTVLQAAAEAVTGQLWLSYSGGDQQLLEATLVQPRPGAVFRITNWPAVQARCRLPDCRSGATVTVTGTRAARAPGSAIFPFSATDLAVVKAAALKRVQVLPTSQTVELAAVAKPDLSSIVLRPQLPEGCPANQLVGGGNATVSRRKKAVRKRWVAVLEQVNALQKACTGGKLSYKAPLVSALLDIPCTPMNGTDTCDPAVYFRWMSDAMEAWKNRTKGDLDAFDHLIVDLPVMEGCGWAGMGLVGGSLLFVNGYVDPLTIAHEMGHGYGLGHSPLIDLLQGGALPGGMPIWNGRDDSNLMGFFSGRSCFSYPHASLLSLASGRQLNMGSYRAGRIVNVDLFASWSPMQQGAVIKTWRQGQESWKVWASFVSTKGTPVSSVLTTNTFDKSILLHLTMDEYDSGRTPWRVASLQSGQVFRWSATGLVFKFGSVGGTGQRAVLRVCRETAARRCSLRPTVFKRTRAAVAGAIRLTLPRLQPDSSWCLRACTSASCALPQGSFPGGLTNAYFTSPCPPGNASLWYSMPLPSGLAKWVNVATGKCLSLQNNTLTYSGTIWHALKYRLVLEDCSALPPPDFRNDGQLFLTEPQPSLGPGLATLTSAMRYPNCPECPVDWRVCAQACNLAAKGGDPQCYADLPAPSNSTSNAVAVAGYCWAAMNSMEIPEQLFRLP